MPTSRQTFTLGAKINLIKKFKKSNQSLAAFCKENSIARGTFGGFLKQQDELLNNGGDIARKRKSKGKYSELEDASSLWIKEKISRVFYHQMH